MKLFGEYLVEKKYISQDVIVKALIEQIKTMPSVPEVIVEHEMLQPEQVLAAFKLQNEKSCTFIESAKQLGFWNQKLAQAVEEKVHSKRVPLGQVLVRMNSITLEKVAAALDDFLAEAEQKLETPGEPAPNGSDSNLFCELFTPGLKDIFDTAFQVTPSGSLEQTSLKKALEEVHRLRGVARLACVANAEPVLLSMESVLGDLVKKEPSAIGADLAKRASESLRKCVDCLWKLSEAVKSGAPDSVDSTLKSGTDELAVLKFDLGF